MPATLQTIGAITNRTPDTLTIAGTESVNVRGELRELSFYHQVRLGQPLAAQVGDAVYLEADLSPHPSEPGRVLLRATSAVPLGRLATRPDARGQGILTGGLNLVTLAGHLVADVQLRELDDGHTCVANVSVRLGARPGLLETSSYGRTARSLDGARKGDPLIMQGRLTHQLRPDASGKKRRYDRIEAFRLTAGDA